MYASTNTIRLIQMSVALTPTEFALTVFSRPCTIHGWRPLSVSSHPAVFIKNGVTTAHTENHKNSFELRSLSLCSSHPPHSASSRTSDARYAITRIDQYWMKTSGM